VTYNSHVITRNLRQRLYKESYEFVKQQRIDCLMQGAWFPITPRSNTLAGSSGVPGSTSDLNSSSNMSGNNNPALMNPSVLIGGSSGHAMTMAASGTTYTGYKWRYFRLSPSKKQLHYGEFTERVTSHLKSYDKLTEKSKPFLICDQANPFS
jgi:engulfment and cell motility protein 1